MKVDLVTKDALKPYIGKQILKEVVYMKKREYRDYLNDILESINDVASFIKSMSYKEFILDKKTINAVIRSIEIIGEAAKHIPKSIKDKFLTFRGKK